MFRLTIETDDEREADLLARLIRVALTPGEACVVERKPIDRRACADCGVNIAGLASAAKRCARCAVDNNLRVMRDRNRARRAIGAKV